jgi:hypothetical protein
MINYTWQISAGGQIVSDGGTTDNSVSIKWLAAGSQNVAVNYENPEGCSALSSTSVAVVVTDLPGKPATPSGPVLLCSNSADTPYATSGSSGAASYNWILQPAGAGIISGTGLTGTVTWTAGWYGTATISVSGHNSGGDGPESDSLSVVINKTPATGTIFNLGTGIYY